MQSRCKTVQDYLASLPDDRRHALEAIRKVILANLDKDLREGMQYGMIGYFVPHDVYPPGYHCDPKQPLPYAGLASQKNHMSLYLFCSYNSPAQQAWFQREWTKTGRKLDMGKACIRFKKLDDLPLDLIGSAVARVPAKEFIAHYESQIKPAGARSKKPAAPKKPSPRTAKSTGKSPTSKAALKSAGAKKAVAKKAPSAARPKRRATS